MKLRDFLPPVVSQAFDRAVARSFMGVQSFLRGDDVGGGQANRLTHPYLQSTRVFAAVNLVSGEFTGLPLKFFRGEVEHVDAALSAWWAAPALGHDRKRIARAEVDQILSMYLQLEGEYFKLLDDSWVTAVGKRNPNYFAPFIIARPDRVQLIIWSGEIQGYAYTDPAGRRTVWTPDQVIHKKEPNPYDDYRGIGRQDVARVAIEGAFLTGTYIRDLMRNNGDQGYIVIGKNGVASDEQRQQIVADLRAKRNALRLGVAKDLFLTGEITVDRPKEQAAGTDLVNTTKLSQQEIFLTFGVPPSMGEVKTAYSMGKESDRYQLITGRSQPVSRTIAGSYAELASKQAGVALTAKHDWDEHPVMQVVRRERFEAAIKLWNTGISWKDVNDILDLGMKPFKGWEVPYLPFSVAPVDTGAAPEQRDPAQDPDTAEDKRKAAPADPGIAQLRLLMAMRTRTKATAAPASAQIEREVLAGFTCNCGLETTAQKADRPPAEIAQWKTLIAARRETMKGFESAYRRVLMQARVEVLRNLHSDAGKALLAKAGTGIEAKATAADFLFNLAKFTVAMRDALEKQHKSGLQKSGEQLYEELGKDDPYKTAPAKVIEFLRGRENRLRDVPQTVYDRLKASLEEGLQAGETQDDLDKRVKSEFNDLAQGEARRISLTETGAVYGAGRQHAMEAAGVPYKMWLTSGNSNVRQAHADANRQTVPVNEPFIVDGEELMHPGDTTGSAGNVINCHCASIATAAPAS